MRFGNKTAPSILLASRSSPVRCRTIAQPALPCFSAVASRLTRADSFGHRWAIATHEPDLTMGEIQEGAKAMMAEQG
jgi:hypothetical protein